MLTELLVKSAGGFFEFRNVVNHRRSGVSRMIYSIVYSHYLQQHSSYVGLDTVFKNKPCFPHGIGGVFISGGAVIGKDCVIFPNVVIGSNTLPGSKGFGAPTIGDNCLIGAGATIVGNVKVGDNCRIGANATIFRDVLSDSTVSSAEPAVHTSANSDTRFYSRRKDGWNYYQNGRFHPVTDPETLERLTRKPG